MGRPSTFKQETADDLCKWLRDGKSLRSYCEQEWKPAKWTVLRWLAENETFRAQYAQAREDQAEALADEIIDIADSADAPDRARVRIDARKWAASKLAPKKYGDKLEHTGPEGGPLEIIVRRTPTELSPSQDAGD